MLTPTQEQLDIIESFKHNKILKVNSCAGAGKSSTLRMLAEHNEVPSLYVCFNKSIAEEAMTKFPKHVTCRTIHSLAYAKFGIYLASKMTRPYGSKINVAKTASEIADYYGIEDIPLGDDNISKVVIASLAKSTLSLFQNSADRKLTPSLIPRKEFAALLKEYPSADKKELTLLILTTAQKLWLDRVNPKSPVLAEHDTYLKMWQLSNPVLNYEIVYLDEAQDSSPVILDILKNQENCRIVYVGDTFQSIYAFRGAVNAMESIDAPAMLLSKSFRYGDSIADFASVIIDRRMNIQGADNIQSTIAPFNEKKYTMIFRGNAALLEEAVKLVSKGKKVSCRVDSANFKLLLESALALYSQDKKKIKHQDITVFNSWSCLVEAAKTDPELKRVQKIVEGNKVGYYLVALAELERMKKTGYDILLTTAHKSKGCEWKNVVIAEDFDIDTILLEPDEKGYNQQEVNLFYVAITRAINKLQLPKELGIWYQGALEEVELRLKNNRDN